MPPLKGEVGGKAARRGSLVKSFYDVFNICGDPSVSAAHCQLPFQGSHILSTSMNYVKSADTAQPVPTKRLRKQASPERGA